MALAKVKVTAQSGGGQSSPSGATVAKTVAVIGVSPKGTPNTVIRIGSQRALRQRLETGPLAEAAAFEGAAIAVPIEPTIAGAKGAVTQTGEGAGVIAVSLAPHRLVEIRITDAGILGTAKYRYRVGGVGPWSEKVTTQVAAWRVPGTFCVLTFGAGTYVLDSTYTIGTNGVVTRGGGAIDTVTHVSSPIDSYDFLLTVSRSGALATAKVIVSPDGGRSVLGEYTIPANGVVVLPGTGVVITGSSTFVEGDTYSFPVVAPGYSTSDLQDAIEALRADSTVALGLLHSIAVPSTAAGAISAGAVVDGQMTDAFDQDGLDWQAIVECPRVGDIVKSGSNAIVDTADDNATVIAARVGQDWKRTALAAGCHRMTSALTGWKLLRPTGWAMAERFNKTNPDQDLSERAAGTLRVYEIGIDALDDADLDEVQINTLQSDRDLTGAFLAITDGGVGYKHLTTDVDYQDAGGVRSLNMGLRELRKTLKQLQGQRPQTNADGTIHKDVAGDWDVLVDQAIKRGVGLAGGVFSTPQASTATAEIDRDSQLGTTPYELLTNYTLQKLGFVAGVSASGTYSGVITTARQAA